LLIYSALLNIFAYGMHMHIKLMNTFGNWLTAASLSLPLQICPKLTRIRWMWVY